jgi:hypothetical protein
LYAAAGAADLGSDGLQALPVAGHHGDGTLLEQPARFDARHFRHPLEYM